MKIFPKLPVLAAALLCAACLALPAAAANGAVCAEMTILHGYVAVVERDTGLPVYVSRVPARALPESDRELLRRGIPLSSQADYTRAVEDFCS